MHAVRLFITQWVRFVIVVLTNFVLAWMLIGCSPAAVFVVSADAAAFQEMLHSEMATDARRPAHLMGFSVRGHSSYKAGVLVDARWPEPYTATVGPSIRPGEYHLAYAAQRLLREQYAATHPQYRALERNELAEIIDEAGGNLYVHEDFAADRVVDLVDVQGRAVFEIVPPGQAWQAAGKEKIDWLLRLINYGLIGQTPFHLGADFHGEMGVRFAEGAVPWKLTWTTTTAAPGIVVYQWLALQVDKYDEDAYRDAYLEHRWRPVTTQEIAKYGRALHEVVERLVQAREELGQTQAAREMPLLPGKTFADYLRTVRLWSAHDDKVAKFLPLMRKPPPPPKVRRDARFLGQTAPGGGSGGPSGGYTVKGNSGNQPKMLHMGKAAHLIIGKQYQLLHGEKSVRVNTVSVSSIVKSAGGNESLLRPDELLIRPDLTHMTQNVVFEIKSSVPGRLQQGQVEVAQYIAAINRSIPRKLFTHGVDYSGDFWVRFTFDMPYWRLTWSTTAPGVVQYNWTKLNDSEVDETKIIKGIADGTYKWIDLTLADVENYAEKCSTFAVMYVDGSEKLYKVQMVEEAIVQILGDATMIFLTPGLIPGKIGKVDAPRTGVTTSTGQSTPTPQPAPGVRTPGNAPPPPSVNARPLGAEIVGRPAPPPVNAPSLGSDARAVVTGAARPNPSPGKTPPAGPRATAPN